jgi:hypothetical protein
VIAGGENLDTGLEQLFGQSGRDAEPGGSVFTVRNYQIYVVIAGQMFQAVANDCPAGPSEDVANEKDSHERTFDGSRTVSSFFFSLPVLQKFNGNSDPSWCGQLPARTAVLRKS